MHRRVINRLPGRLTLGCRILVDIAIADRGNRPPEIVMIHRRNKTMTSGFRPAAPNRNHNRHEPCKARIIEQGKIPLQLLVGNKLHAEHCLLQLLGRETRDSC